MSMRLVNKKPPADFSGAAAQLYQCLSMHQYLSGRQVMGARSPRAVIADRSFIGDPRAPKIHWHVWETGVQTRGTMLPITSWNRRR
jgi:hypothetical protein